MLNDISEIRTAVNQFKSDVNFLYLQTRWDGDLDLFRGRAYDAGQGYYSYTSNSPTVFAQKILSLLIQSKLIIRIPLEVLTDEERRKASNQERFWYGCIGYNDDRLYRLSLPTLRELKAWYAALRGGYLQRAYVYKNDKGKTCPDVDIWDIYDCAYGKGKDGLVWAAHTRKITKSEAKEIYGKDSGSATREVEVVDFWDTEKYGVIVGEDWGQPLEKHGLDYCPVHLIQVGATPVPSHKSFMTPQSLRGESIYASNRNLYPILNKTMSDYLTLVRRGVKMPMVHKKGSGGAELAEADIFRVDKGAIIDIENDEDLKPLMPPSMPQNASELMQFISGEEQRGSLSHTTYGDLGFRLSGYAINQLQTSIETVMQPCIDAITRGDYVACRELASQFVKGKFAPIAIHGRTSRNETFGMPKAQEITYKDIEPDWMPEVRLEPTLPKDDFQMWQMARIALQTGLLSKRTTRDEIVGIADPDQEESLLKMEWASELPIPRLYEAYLHALLVDKREDVARNILAELQRLLGQLGASMPNKGGGGGSPQPPPVTENVATGVPPSVLPQEAMGNVPPGSQNAAVPPAQGGV